MPDWLKNVEGHSVHSFSGEPTQGQSIPLRCSGDQSWYPQSYLEGGQASPAVRSRAAPSSSLLTCRPTSLTSLNSHHQEEWPPSPHFIYVLSIPASSQDASIAQCNGSFLVKRKDWCILGQLPSSYNLLRKWLRMA